MMEIAKVKAADGTLIKCLEKDCRNCSVFPKLTKLSEVTRSDAAEVAKSLRRILAKSKSARNQGLPDKFDVLLAGSKWKP